jgi:hypothetical protein
LNREAAGEDHLIDEVAGASEMQFVSTVGESDPGINVSGRKSRGITVRKSKVAPRGNDKRSIDGERATIVSHHASFEVESARRWVVQFEPFAPGVANRGGVHHDFGEDDLPHVGWR